MSVAWVAGSSSAGGTITSATMTVSHTVAAGSNRMILLRVPARAASGAAVVVSAVVRNGQAFTNVTDLLIGTALRFTEWVLVNPTVGTFNISITFSRTLTVQYAALADNFTGVDQTTPVNIAGKVSASGTGATSYNASVPGTVPFLSQCLLASDAGSSQWSLSSSSDTTDLRSAASTYSLLLMRHWTVGAPSNPYTAAFAHTTATSYFYSALQLNAAAGSSSYTQAISATSAPAATLARTALRARGLSATATPAATLARALTRRMTLSAAAAAVATLARATRFARGLSASGRGVATFAIFTRPLPKRLLATPVTDGVAATAKKR